MLRAWVSIPPKSSPRAGDGNRLAVTALGTGERSGRRLVPVILGVIEEGGGLHFRSFKSIRRRAKALLYDFLAPRFNPRGNEAKAKRMDEIPNLSLAEIEETRAMIAPHVVRTPVHDCKGGDRGAGGARHARQSQARALQRSGTLQGAGRGLEGLAAQRGRAARGITAVSAGNHAIAAAMPPPLGRDRQGGDVGSANPARVAGAARSAPRW